LASYWTDEVAYVKAYRDFRMTGIELAGSNVTVSFTTLSNRQLAVDTATNLTGNTWGTVTSGVMGTGGILQVIDPGGASNSQRFYRARIVP
jgi:hypothetical protein